MKYRQALGNRILVLPTPDVEEKTEGGVILAITTTATKPKKGIIEAVGIKVNAEIKRDGGKALSKGDEILYDRAEFPIIVDNGIAYEQIFLDHISFVL